MRHSLIAVALWSSVLALSQTAAHAQPADEAVPPAPPPQAAACVPSCRNGYTCVGGQCVSECNPPCAAGERCSAGACSTAPRSAAEDHDWSQSPPPGAETHTGFMLRLTLGVGYGVVSASRGATSELKITGVSGSFALDIGAAVTENAIVHARISDLVLVDPHVSIDGNDLGTANDLSVGAIFVGPAFTYYFMPVNIYVTAAVGMSWIRLTNNAEQTSASTDLGLGINADVGKEWWVSDNWGLGVAGRFWFTHTADREAGIDVDYDLSGFAVLFSATFQ